MSHPVPALLRAYRVATTLLEPAALPLLRRRLAAGKEVAERLGERRGLPGEDRPTGDLAWVHGASVGEILAVLPLVEKLTRRGLAVLVTSGTRTSADLAARRLPPGAMHQFLPLDVPRFVRRFLDHWQPQIALFVESELWPNVVLELERRVVPLVLVNARMSARSFRRWQKTPALARAIMRRLSLCVAQSEADAERLGGLGALRVQVSGNLKFDVPPPPADPETVESLSGKLAGRRIWVAASTHPGEEEMILAAHVAAARRRPDLLTIVAPRHPHRGEDVAAVAAKLGLKAERRSTGAQPDRSTQVYVADTIGELGLFYRVSPLVFMGGSLVPHGGQNPIEPAKLGCALLHGPHVENFRDVFRALDAGGGALAVADGEALGQALDSFLGDAALLRRMARSAGVTVDGLGGALARTLQAVEPYMPHPRMSRP